MKVKEAKLGEKGTTKVKEVNLGRVDRTKVNKVKHIF